MTDFWDSIAADRYLEHKYPAKAEITLPLPDEDFVRNWRVWLADSSLGALPGAVRDIMSGGGARAWVEETPAGGIPVIYAKDRRVFERLTAFLSLEDDSRRLPPSVNAFTVPAKHPEFGGHRVICLAEAGYSAISGDDAGFPEDEWLKLSEKIRLHHERCHYFTLRIMGGMKNHALDEVIADCMGQLAAFGRFDASLEMKFLGADGSSIKDGGRLWFYVKKLPEAAVPIVCESVKEAVGRLEAHLRENPEMAAERERPELIMKLAAAGLKGIMELM
jgi:hypothetical protein